MLERDELRRQLQRDEKKNAPGIRHVKVYETSGYKYKSTPTIILKGEWLRRIGFDINEKVEVVCEDGKLAITKNRHTLFECV